jgi:hypothetical protein
MTSKLGLALQITTRVNTLLKNTITLPSNANSARKQGIKLDEEQDKCIVCDYTEVEMIKYYKTIAQLFANEQEFITLFEKSNAFCIKHYAKLLQYANYAGLSAKNI